MKPVVLMKSLCLAICVMGLMLSLNACGKRPRDVDPPAGAKPTDFPARYPRS